MNKLSQIKKAITDFITAGDTNDASLLDKVLHPRYLNIQDGFFEQPGICVIPKDEYIELVCTERFGGSPRTIEFTSVEDLGNIAIAKLKLESERLQFLSYITVALEGDSWLVINNTPTVKLKPQD